MTEDIIFMERICWNCEDRFYYQVKSPPTPTAVFCPHCKKFQGSAIWAEMDDESWICFPILKDTPLPNDIRTYYIKEHIPSKLRWAIYERDNYTCKHCGSKSDLSIDHIKPEFKGGTLDKENLQTLCKSCNSKKGIK